MTETNSLSKLASKANGAFNSVTANSTALTSITIGNVSINAVAIIASSGAGLHANGSFGVPGDVLTSNGTGLYWSVPSAGVNVAAQYVWGNLNTFQANLHVGNSTVNTQHSNSAIHISNSTSTTVVTLADIRVGNTATNVVIANTVSTFGGNVAVTGEVKVSGALRDNTNRRLLIRDSANNIIWGS